MARSNSQKMRKNIAKSVRARAYAKTDGWCWYCGRRAVSCLDHIVPVKDGGTNDYDNLVPSCEQCNLRKGVLSVEGFRAKWSLSIGKAIIFTFEYQRTKGID